MTDQVSNKMLGLMQALAMQQSARKPGGKTDAADAGGFQKQLEKYQKDQNAPNGSSDSKEPSTTGKAETETTEKPVVEENPTQGPKDETVETQQRMALAAMATFQAPVVLTETPEPPAEVVEMAAVAVVDETLAAPETTEDGPVDAAPVFTPQQEGPAVPVEAEEPQKAEVQPQQAEQPVVEAEPEQVEKVQTTERPVETETVQTEARPVAERTESAEVPQEKGEDVQVVDAGQAPQALFQDVEAAPIKVGETMTTDQPEEAQDVGDQVAEPLMKALEKGDSRVEISLTPETLGNVRVEITRSQDGSLHVALSADTAQTRSLLEKHAGNLQNLLVDRNQGMVQVEVQRQQESQQNQNQNQNPNNNSYDGRNGHGQDRQQEQRHGQQHSERGEDFLQQLRLGLIPEE